MQIPSLLYLVSKIFWRVVQPGDLLILLLGLGFILLFTRRNRLGIAVIALSVLLVSSIAVLPIGHWLLAPLERRFPYVTDMPARVDGVIMLGGGGGPQPAPGRHHPGVEDRAQDFVVFADLARRYPGAKLVFAGGGPLSQDGAFREADAAREALNSMGIDTSRVTFERESRNTFENVVMRGRWCIPHQVKSGSSLPRPSICLARLAYSEGRAGRSFPARRTPDRRCSWRRCVHRSFREESRPDVGRA